MEIQIIQITATSYVNADDESFTKVFGLGSDGKVYLRSYQEWQPY